MFPLKPFRRILKKALGDLRRDGPVDLIRFPSDSANRFVDDRGEVHLEHDMLRWVRL